jgi:hypothetical protein
MVRISSKGGDLGPLKGRPVERLILEARIRHQVNGMVLSDAQGQVLTKEQLRNPGVFREATQLVPNYPQSYTYETTSRVHLSRVPVIGEGCMPSRIGSCPVGRTS